MNASGRLPSDFADSAAYPLFACSPASDKAWILHFSVQNYTDASFLDQRLFHAQQYQGWEVTGAELDGALAGATLPKPPLHWLFHIGHCGSTLVSRMLDLIPGVLGLREPLPLLELAGLARDAATEKEAAAITLWRQRILQGLGRGFSDTRWIVVKPTSVTTWIAQPLLEARPGSRALLLWCDLETWLTTMLRTSDLREAAAVQSSFRIAAWKKMHSPPVSRMGEQLARDWLAEQWHWSELKRHPHLNGSIADFDFSKLLASPLQGLAKIAGHYGIPLPDGMETMLQISNLMNHYAKDQRYAFNPQTRNDELARSRKLHENEIEAGLRWAERTSSGHSDIRARFYSTQFD